MTMKLPARILALGLVFALFAVSLLPLSDATVQAQDGDGLSDEQIAQLQRILDASSAEDYDSYVQVGTSQSNAAIEISFLGMALEVNQTVNQESTATVIKGDPYDNISAQIIADVESTNSFDQSVSSYTLNADARQVEGVTYMQVTSEGDAPELEELPEGWFMLDDPAQFDALTNLQLDLFFGDEEDSIGAEGAMGGASDVFGNVLTNEMDVLQQILSDVTVEAETLEDGTAVERITLTFDWESLIQEGIDVGALDLDELEEVAPGLEILEMADINFTASVLIDAEERIRGVDVLLGIDLPELDLYAMAEAMGQGTEDIPEGTTMGFIVTADINQVFTQINDESLMPVEAPPVE
jgi:hypothetical protein